MSTTKTEAGYFSNAAKACGVALSARIQDQVFGLLPFKYIEGHQLDIAKVDASGISGYATVIPDTGGSPALTFPDVGTFQIPLTHFAAILEVDSLVVDQYGSHRDILRPLIDIKVAAIVDLFRNRLVNGEGAAGEFSGLVELASTYANTVGADGDAANGGPVQAGEIEAMLAMLAPQHGLKNRYLVMNSQTLNSLRSGAYQNDVYFIEHPQEGPLPAIAGVPVLVNNHIRMDQIKGASANLTSIFGIILEPDTGVFGILPCTNRGQEVRVLGPFLKEGSEILTFHLQMQAGVGLGNEDTVAALDGVQWT